MLMLQNAEMHPLLAAALRDSQPMVASRGWSKPSPATLAEADRLLKLTLQHRAPEVDIDPTGAVRLEWEAASDGWLVLTVDGTGQVKHSAVIDEDEFEKSEVFDESLPEWAKLLLARLVRVGH